MPKYNIPPQFECPNIISNVKIRYSALVRVSKYDILNDKNDIRLYFECQNRILNVKMSYSAPVRMSK